ncbi:hypothetical protein LPJ55_002328 [Coemansia sp. RSA 990]|nr:hypothetical protein BX667DRAFT_6969 [Coemansia mojavensis]KAJ1748209.1 hypothetical protein LPJ79_004704 [Coemansia sp. RSA 1821]KAJ1873377.1 hypothetical protein LPJ55_002328 [Coemansia sp. RSA 990]
MSTEEFTIPIDSEFVLYQGWVTRNTRRRRKSDASVPSTMSSTSSSCSPVPIRRAERRRNTVNTSHVYNLHSRMSADKHLVQSPPQIPAQLPLPDSSVNNSEFLQNPMTASSLPADLGQLDTSNHMMFVPLSPPQSPSSFSRPVYSRKRHASSLPVPQIPLPPIPEHVSESSVAEQANGSVTCLVLDNKKICFARPRLVQIGSPSSL